MPDATLAVIAFIGGAIFNAIMNAITTEYRARRDHQRTRELDRGSRDRQAASAILEATDQLMEKYTLAEGLRRVEQSVIQPPYRVIRRRSVELADPKVRTLIDEIAEGYYYFVPNVTRVRQWDPSEYSFAHGLQNAARQILGAVVRGEPVVEPPYLDSDLRPIAKDLRDMWSALYEDEEESTAATAGG